MRRVVWSRAARVDFAQIYGYIRSFNPDAARRLAQRLAQVADGLAYFPERGRPSEGSSREIAVVYPYVIRYEVDGSEVLILRIRHGSRRPD